MLEIGGKPAMFPILSVISAAPAHVIVMAQRIEAASIIFIFIISSPVPLFPHKAQSMPLISDRLQRVCMSYCHRLPK